MNFCKFLYPIKEHLVTGLLIFDLLTAGLSKCFCAFEKTEAGAATTAMGNAVVAVDNLSYAIYFNPAALSDSISFQIALSYQMLFEIKELSQVDLIVNGNIAGLPVACALSQFGNKVYRETQFSVGSKYKITPVCVIGVGFQYYHLAIAHYGYDSSWGLNLALLCSLSPAVKLGAFVTNLNKPRISGATEPLPQTMDLGLSYSPERALKIGFALHRDIHFPLDFRAGISYSPLTVLTLRAGIENQTGTYSFGFGFNQNWLNCDYAIKVHSELGYTHIFSVVVSL